MEENMAPDDGREYRNETTRPRSALALVRGDAPRAMRAQRRADVRRQLDRETHALVVAGDTARVPAMFADWWYDLRRKQLRVYGGLLRFLDLAHDVLGTRKETLLVIPQMIEAYIHELYADDPPTRENQRAA